MFAKELYTEFVRLKRSGYARKLLESVCKLIQFGNNYTHIQTFTAIIVCPLQLARVAGRVRAGTVLFKHTCAGRSRIMVCGPGNPGNRAAWVNNYARGRLCWHCDLLALRIPTRGDSGRNREEPEH